MAGYFDEAIQVRKMLNSRYDDLKSGGVKPIPGEVEAYFRESKRRPAFAPAWFMTGYDFHPEGRIDLDEIWEFIARFLTPRADDCGDFGSDSRLGFHFPALVTDAPISPRGLCASFWYMNI